MNQDEDVPTRVTRGALRRRSVDQEATPQKPTGAAVGGTPKKANSTTKRAAALNAIQESDSGRPSTPIVGRTTRRRMSETIDTPTTLPNKLVQNLKEAESTSTEPGRRSRNASLTEENLNELNSTFEGNSTTLTTRSRTPARLRASHEALASISSPQPITGVRRSTRRNSVNSDDGNSSVQSLPVTTSKLGPSVRALKDDTIIEEDDRDDRAESVSSDTSTRQTRAQSALSTVSLSTASPRRSPASPVLDVKAELTPPRGSKTPRVAVTPLSISKLSPRSKNVSFSEDAKRDDYQSALPKTPTSVTKEMFVVVEDLRNSELKGASPRVAATVNVSPKTAESEKKSKPVDASPTCENLNSEHQSLNETDKSASKDKMNDSTASMIAAENEECAEGTLTANDVSGIEVLDSSVKDTTNTTVIDANDVNANDSSRTADQPLSEGTKFATSWSQSVRRSATKGIDEYSVRKQEEQERLEKDKDALQKEASLDSSQKTRSPASKQQSSELKKDEDDTSEEQEDEDEETRDRNEFVDDEAMEVEDYQSCDSMDSELRKEIVENEIPEQGEDLGSEDTEDEQEDDQEDGNDSWIVSDGEEMEPMEEDELLQSSNDDEAPMAEEEPKKATRFRRIVNPVDDSDEEEKTSSPAKSPKRSTANVRRSATPALSGENDNLTPTKKSDVSESRDDTAKAIDKTTPNVKAASMETSGVGEEMETTGGVPITPTVGKKTPSKLTLKSPSAVTMDTTKESEDEKQDVSVAGEKLDAKDDATVVDENIDKKEESDHLADKEEKENGDKSTLSISLSKSPKKATSRKSLPANAENITESQSIVAGTRKSLPASAKLLSANETIAKTDANEVEDEQPEPDQRNESVEEIVDLDENSDVAPDSSPNKVAQNDSLSVEVTLEQPSNDANTNTGRKSMPPVSLISAQFYIGAGKKRNTIGGGNTNAVTSTPKQPAKEMVSAGKKVKERNQSEANKMVGTVGTSVVPNPFALAKGGKLKSRASLDSGVATAVGQQQPLAAKKARLSLPPKLSEEESPSSQSEPASQQPAPEPMEVDEVPEEEENVVNGEEAKATEKNGDTTDGEDEEDSVQEVEPAEKQRSKGHQKPKAKALEDYDLANILVRCNEFVREDKERKKQVASVLRKKKEEKKKQRELEKEQELEAAKTAAANALAASSDDPNSTNASTGNSTVQGEESLKKKKKRKPKKVNYLLEELAETKKDRMEQALRRKLETIERRKQRKKERQLEKKMQDKENGDGSATNVATVAASGIGAKLEKLKKKAKTTTKQEKDTPKEPPVRVALSAYAVFHQIPTKQVELPLPSVAAKDGKQTKSDESSAEKKQPLKATEPTTKAKKHVDSAEQAPTETSNVNKKSAMATQPEAVHKRDALPLLQSATVGNGILKEVGKMPKKQKKKQAMVTKTLSNGDSHQRNEIVEVMPEPAEPARKVQKPKEKKGKEQVMELPLNEADSGTVPKQKKNKKIKQLVAVAEEKLSSAMNAMLAEAETVRNVKKVNKKLASHTISDLQEEPAVIVPGKKRKREQQGGDNSSVASTPRPAKHTKLRVLQRIESGGFFEESVTPDKLRLKRNFGFDERQATPAKQLGFRVSSLLPTGQDELRDMATLASKKSAKEGRSKPGKFGAVIATERNASLPLPVWTSSGVFLESAIDGDGGDGQKKKAQTSKPISGAAAESGFIQLKTQGKGDFSLKKLQPGPTAEKPHHVDPSTTAQSVLNFKRQQLLEKTAHLRDKKKSHRM